MLAFDHVIIAVDDLEAASRRLWDRHGLATVPGGRHPGHGTGNRIAPLGAEYLELMAVVDHEEAARSPLGRFVAGFVAAGGGLMALCLRTDDIDAVANRLGVPALSMSRQTPDGRTLRWRLAGLELALGPERLPFFIQWDIPQEDHPGRAEAGHRDDPSGIAAVRVGGDPARLATLLGPSGPAIEVDTAADAGTVEVRLGGGLVVGRDALRP